MVMVDPIALTAAALVAKACYEFAGEAGKSAWQGAGHAVQLIKNRLRNNHRAESALARVVENADDQDRIYELAEVLDGILTVDPQFRHRLVDLIGDVDKQSDTVTFLTEIRGGFIQKQVNVGVVRGDLSL